MRVSQTLGLKIEPSHVQTTFLNGWMGVSQTLGLKIEPSHVQTTFLNGWMRVSQTLGKNHITICSKMRTK
jgi:hypothetical protein